VGTRKREPDKRGGGKTERKNALNWAVRSNSKLPNVTGLNPNGSGGKKNREGFQGKERKREKGETGSDKKIERRSGGKGQTATGKSEKTAIQKVLQETGKTPVQEKVDSIVKE